MTAKADGAFRTISEVSEMLDVPAHVLRFWETKFNTLKPLKRNGGRRYYRPDDVELLVRIRDLLYHEGYAIRGAQKLLASGDALPDSKTSAKTQNVGSLEQAAQMLGEVRSEIARMKVALGA